MAKTGHSGFFRNLIDKAVEGDELPVRDRVGEIAAIAAMLAMVVFFVIHQTRPTGFFTSRFRSVETLLFYLSPVLGMVRSALTVAMGRRNVLRPYEAAQNGVLAIAVAWFLAVFPFDFSHLADVLPGSIRFLLSWISNGFAMFLMAIALISFSVLTVHTALLYLIVRDRLASKGL